MPQLDTIYILLTYLWTWLTLHLLMKKVKTILIIKTPKLSTHETMKPKLPNLPWT